VSAALRSAIDDLRVHVECRIDLRVPVPRHTASGNNSFDVWRGGWPFYARCVTSSGWSLRSGSPCGRVEICCSRSLPSATNCAYSFVRIAAFAHLTVCSGWCCDSCGLGGETHWFWSSRPRRSVASRGVPSMPLATSWQTTHRFRMSRLDSALGRRKLSLGRSANPRRVTQARDRRLRTHGVAVSAMPTTGAVTDVAYLPRESSRSVHVHFARDVRVRARR
jgi:hypothetical protein